MVEIEEEPVQALNFAESKEAEKLSQSNSGESEGVSGSENIRASMPLIIATLSTFSLMSYF